MILIDSDVLIEILDKQSEVGRTASEKVIDSGEKFCTSVINLHEILYGYRKYSKYTDETILLPVLDYTRTDALLSSKLEADAAGSGTGELRADAMIAAIAIDNGCKLYTNNKKDFQNFKGLEFF